MFVKLTEDLAVNPDLIEMVQTERVGAHTQVHIHFRSGYVKTLPRNHKLEDVMAKFRGPFEIIANELSNLERN